jgi:aminomethyltransferase
LRRTPLFDAHVALGARMVDFAGWEMPVQYQGPVEETRHTRTAVGLFDLCHMGRLELTGREAVAAADAVASCNVGKLPVGACKYGLLCNETGGVLDDILAYRDADRVHLIINAGNRDRDHRHVLEQAGPFECEVANRSDEQTMLALQGRGSLEVLQPHCDRPLSGLGYYRFFHAKVAGVPALVSRTGYTGEDGFELFFTNREARRIWDLLLATGRAQDLKPIGLAARDILRTEAGMPLYGHEIDERTSPLEAGLDFGVDLAKDFLGASALRTLKERGLPRRLVGLTLGARVARAGYEVRQGGRTVGKVTSGTPSPTLGTNIAMALVEASVAGAADGWEVDIRGKPCPATPVPLPFYKRPRPKKK